jgi:hypothetical protein
MPRIDITADPDSIDWIARSREDRDDEPSAPGGGGGGGEESKSDEDADEGDVVWVSNVHEAPPDTIVHASDDGLFYYDTVDHTDQTETEDAAPGPGEEKSWEERLGESDHRPDDGGDAARLTVRLLERLFR